VILQRALLWIAAAAALAAAAVIGMIALAFAVYGFLVPHVGPANASAGVAALFAFLIGLGGLLAGLGLRGARRRRTGRYEERDALGLADRVMEVARDRPLAAVGVALAVGVILVRSPSALSAISRAFFDSVGGRERRRRWS
jgi:hypothetical protein